MKFTTTLFLPALWCTLSVTGWAATWYVRPVAPAGTYGPENGTSYANAFNGLTEAERGPNAGLRWGPGGIQAGDTLYICGNHWLQIPRANRNFPYSRITVPILGTPDNPITIRSDAPQEAGILWGYGRDTSLPDVWTGPDANGVYFINRDLGAYIAQDVPLGEGATVYLNQMTTSTWVGLPGSFFRNATGTYVKTTNGASPAGRLYTGNIAYRFALERNEYLTFKNFKSYGFLLDVDRDSGGEQIVGYPRSNNITYDGCTLRYSRDSFFRLYDGNHFWRFYDCIMEYGPDAIVTIGTLNDGSGGVGSSFMHVRGCQFRHLGVLMYPHQDAHALGIRRGRGHVFENNIIEDTGAGIEFWTSVGNPMRDMTVRYNFLRNIKVKSRTFGGGIVISGDNPATTGTVILGERTGFNIYGNIVMDAEGPGISSNNQDVVTLTNNVLHNCSVGIRLEVVGGLPVRARVINNIISAPREGYLDVPGTNHFLDWDYNIYYSPTQLATRWNPWGSFNAWRSLFDTDWHSREIDPGFVSANPAGPFDFRLKNTSYAINTGLATGLNYDFAGAPVPSLSLPDIGAFEFQFKNAAGPGWLAYQ